MKGKLIIILVALIIAVASGWLFFGKKDVPQEISLPPQTNSEGAVEIEVTPTNVTKGSSQWRFDIVLNTHSIELDQDMTKVALLEDDQGNVYLPTAWEGAPPGGHHREGTLIFAPIKPKPKTITLVLKDIGGVSERILSW